MKYCRNCGKELYDEAIMCPGCGATQEVNQQQSQSSKDATFKGGLVGFLLTFFIGLIGFILCLCLGDEPCKKAAKITFFVSLAVSVVLVLFYACVIAAAVGSGALY